MDVKASFSDLYISQEKNLYSEIIRKIEENLFLVSLTIIRSLLSDFMKMYYFHMQTFHIFTQENVEKEYDMNID